MNAAQWGDVGKIAALGEQNPRLLVEPVQSNGETALIKAAYYGQAAGA